MDASYFAEFRRSFEACLDTPSDIGSIIKYNAVRNSDYKHIIFVEGNGDRLFYGNCPVPELSDNTYYIFASMNDEYKGKDSVMKSFEVIYNDTTLSSGMSKCIFLVDRDWDNRIDGNQYRLNKKYIDDFTITRGHSMENYFLEEENLKVLFELFGKSSDYSGFLENYHTFIKETAYYWGLKSAKIYADKHNIPARYSQKHSWDEIFSFCYKNETPEYHKNLLAEEIKNLENVFSSSPNLMDYAKKKEALIANTPRMVRGHQAFDYLNCYFKGKYGIELVISNKTEYKKIFDAVKKFHVELDGKSIE